MYISLQDWQKIENLCQQYGYTDPKWTGDQLYAFWGQDVMPNLVKEPEILEAIDAIRKAAEATMLEECDRLSTEEIAQLEAELEQQRKVEEKLSKQLCTLSATLIFICIFGLQTKSLNWFSEFHLAANSANAIAILILKCLVFAAAAIGSVRIYWNFLSYKPWKPIAIKTAAFLNIVLGLDLLTEVADYSFDGVNLPILKHLAIALFVSLGYWLINESWIREDFRRNTSRIEAANYWIEDED